MAALVFFCASSAFDLYELTDALVRCDFSLKKSLRYLKIKKERILYYKYCREFWLRGDYYKTQAVISHSLNNTTKYTSAINNNKKYALKSSGKTTDEIDNRSQAALLSNMKRGGRGSANVGIDFAAIEASAEAFEVIDAFGKPSSRNFLDGECAAAFSPVEEQFDDIEVLSGQDVDITFYEFADTYPVYQNNDLGAIYNGVSFHITGTIMANCERFSINFIIPNESNDIALHVNPRLPQCYIVRNTKVKNIWGKEEVSSALPFSLERGAEFAIQVLVTTECFMISVNGHHFAQYTHRLPFSEIGSLEVRGDVENIKMQCSRVTTYPERLPHTVPKKIPILREPDDSDDIDTPGEEILSQDTRVLIPQKWSLISMKKTPPEKMTTDDLGEGLPMPYYGKLPPKALLTGRYITIEGRVKLLPHSFYINLQHGQHIWPHPVIAFHFNPRFSKSASGALGKAVVCRNAWYNGSWADEERSELDTDFRPGKTFRMAIVCCEEEFEVWVNDKLITRFLYRVRPELVDTVYIQGDIKLWNVLLEKNYNKKCGQQEST